MTLLILSFPAGSLWCPTSGRNVHSTESSDIKASCTAPSKQDSCNSNSNHKSRNKLSVSTDQPFHNQLGSSHIFLHAPYTSLPWFCVQLDFFASYKLCRNLCYMTPGYPVATANFVSILSATMYRGLSAFTNWTSLCSVYKGALTWYSSYTPVTLTVSLLSYHFRFSSGSSSIPLYTKVNKRIFPLP